VVDLVEPVDPRDRINERIEFQAALQELKKLPPLLQEVVFVRSRVSRQADVAEVMGLSRQRVVHLLIKAGLRVAQLNEERHADERPVASPRWRKNASCVSTVAAAFVDRFGGGQRRSGRRAPDWPQP
jgi:hypothetical protein